MFFFPRTENEGLVHLKKLIYKPGLVEAGDNPPAFFVPFTKKNGDVG